MMHNLLFLTQRLNHTETCSGRRDGDGKPRLNGWIIMAMKKNIQLLTYTRGWLYFAKEPLKCLPFFKIGSGEKMININYQLITAIQKQSSSHSCNATHRTSVSSVDNMQNWQPNNWPLSTHCNEDELFWHWTQESASLEKKIGVASMATISSKVTRGTQGKHNSAQE